GLLVDLPHVHRSFFFFSSRRRHTRFSRDWSSDCALPILAAYFLLSYRPFAEDWREAALQAHVHVAAMALYLFFLPGSLLVPLLATAGNSLYTALSPVAGADPEGTAETPGAEEPR